MRASASRTGLLARCTYWASDGVLWDETSSYAARRSTELHGLIARYVYGAPLDIPGSKWVSDRFTYVTRWLNAVPDTIRAAEVAFAWRDGEVECFGLAERKDYPEDAFCGTIDLLEWDPINGHLTILDWKGVRSLNHDAVWPQLEVLAMMAYKWAKAFLPVQVVIIVAAHCHEGGVVAHPRRLSPEHLEGIEARLSANLSRVDSDIPSPGDWCKTHYCPARTHCRSAA